MLNLYINPEGESARLLQQVRRGVSSSAFGLSLGERAYLTARLDRPVLYIASDHMTAWKACKAINSYAKAYFFPAKEEVLLHARTSRENTADRLRTLGSMLEGAKIVVAPVEAVLQRTVEPRALMHATQHFEVGGRYSLDQIAARLVAGGYERCATLEGAGEFSLRGDILDIAPATGSAVRLEFFGSELESIRELSLATNLSKKKLDRVSILPAVEMLADDSDIQQAFSRISVGLKQGVADELEREVRLGRRANLEILSTVIDSQGFSIVDYLSENAVVVFDEAKDTADCFNYTYKEFENRFKALLADGMVNKAMLGALCPPEEIYRKASAYTELCFHNTLSQNRMFTPEAVFTIQKGLAERYTHSPDKLADDLKIYARSGYRVVLAARDEAAQDRIGLALFDRDVLYSKKLEQGAGIYVLPVTVEESAIFPNDKLAIIGTYALMSRGAEKRIVKAGEVFTATDVGDYVVHTKHGIGVIDRVETISGIFGDQEYIVVRYAGGDKLYVPSIETHRLSRYSGSQEVKLNKIGGAEFERIKAKAAKSIKAMAFDLAKLYAARETAKGAPIEYDSKLLADFCASFAFAETDDQLKATADILADFSSGKIMDRLLCGDVGYGKTEVALRAAFAMITAGKQVAFLSPTTILTEQHYRTAKERMEEFGVNIGVLSRFHTDGENKKVVQQLKAGELDIVFGTHRLLSRDVDFKSLGLLVLDEEQRFGVEHKEKLKTIKTAVSVLTMTATPIPRTLHLSMSRIRDMSTLDTPPADRLPVRTVVTEYSEQLIADAAGRELARGGQAFIVYNRVQSIDAFAADVARILPHARVVVAHGQMDEATLEKRIDDFYLGEGDVLVSSTIIENGIDIARAGTLIVVDSDRFGLSQLYQLRGRVGRSNRLAYAYFTYNSNKEMSQNAYKRLNALAEFTEFGSGIKLAMRDLEIRGAGSVLGRDQHGHMEKIGYDMYLKLLKDAVDAVDTADEKPKKETKINLKLDAVIPESFVTESSERMYLYQKIARISSEAERQSMLRELSDIYGKLPKAMVNLTRAALVRYHGEKIGATTIDLGETECNIYFDTISEVDKAVLFALEEAEGCVLKMNTRPVIVFDARYKPHPLDNLCQFLDTIDME